jgi:branched-chain amino acid transport system substrate-binding protein
MTRDRTLAMSLLVLFSVALGEHAHSATDPITLGVHLPMSGERAPVGRIITNAVELAVQEVNRNGGIKGAPLRPAFENSGGSADSAAASAQKLIDNQQVVAIVGELFSPFVLASRDRVEQAGVPYLTGGTSPRTTENARWIFRVAANDTLLADLMARYVVEQLKLKKLAILSSRVGVHNARAELLVKVLHDKYGIAPSVRETWKSDDRDFSAQLAMVKADPVQAIIALGETAEAAAFLKQAKALVPDALVIAHRDFGARSALDQAGEAANNVLIVTEYVPQFLDAERQAWAEAFRGLYGTEPGIIGAQYYDAVLLLAAAMRTSGTSREQIRAGLEQLRAFRGMMGDYTFDARRNGLHRFYVAKIIAGQPRLEVVLDEVP